MSSRAHVPSSSSKKPKWRSMEKTLPPIASTLKVVQFDPGNDEHYAKAPKLFRALQGRFADPASASKSDVYAFADQCIFMGAVIHDELAWDREGSRAADNNEADMDVDHEKPSSKRFVGLFYILSTSSGNGEMNIGLVLDTNFDDRNCEYFVIHKALDLVFNVFNCHRAQVAVIEDGKNSMKSKELLVSIGFVFEGTKRMSVFSPLHSTWRDVMYFAMLDTEWLFKRFDALGAPLNPKSVWDEMLGRHKKETDEVLYSEGHTLKRTSSSETIRVTMTECGATETSSVIGVESDLASQSGESRRRASISSRTGILDGAARASATRNVNPFISDLDGTESSSSRQNPFEIASVVGDGPISWTSVLGGPDSQDRDVASIATAPPFSSCGTVSSTHSESGEKPSNRYDFSMYTGNDGTTDSRTLLRKMMEESLSGQVSVAGPSKVRDWLDSTGNFTAAAASTNVQEREESVAARSASDHGDGGEVANDSDYGVISDESMEKDESNDEWEVLSGEA